MRILRLGLVCTGIVLAAMIYFTVFVYSGSQNSITFYVDAYKGNDNNTGLTSENAFKTIKKAQYAVRTKNKDMKSNIDIILAGGTYSLSEGLTFSSADSGQNGFKVIYKNASGQTPVLDGGMEIKNWTLYDSGKRIYRASVSPGTKFRQLYINNGRAVRARTPNKGSSGSVDGYFTGGYITTEKPWRPVVDEEKLRGINITDGVEMVMECHWMERRIHPIAASVSNGKVTLSLRPQEENFKIMNQQNQENVPYYFENSFGFLDQPGEWFLDSWAGYVYYIPPVGINPSTLKIVAPQVESLIKIFGESSKNQIHDVVFQGLTLINTNFTLPDEMGCLSGQAGVALANDNVNKNNVPGAVTMHNASRIELSGLKISNAGAHGIVADSDIVSNCNIHDCTIRKMAGGGIYLDLVSSESASNTICNNRIYSIGIDYTDIVGILAMRAPDTTIQNNTVEMAPYTGISVGWQWDDKDSEAKNITVLGNYISYVMLLHDDGGGIYTLGKIPGCRIENNYICNLYPSNVQGGYPIAGIYLDNGSSYKVIEKNIIKRCPIAVTAKNKPVHDNTLSNNFYDGNFMDDISDNTLSGNSKVSASYMDSLLQNGSYGASN